MKNPEIIVPTEEVIGQRLITSETDWPDFKTGLKKLHEVYPDLNLNHFDDHPEDDQLMTDFFNIRLQNMQGQLSTEEVLDRQGAWMDEADGVENFWKRRSALISLITESTLSPEDKIKANERKRHRKRR